MEPKIEIKVDEYLEMLKEIETRANNMQVALVIMQEVNKDMRMHAISEQRKANENLPATEKQKDYLKRLSVKFSEEITKGEASALIDKAKQTD